MDRSLFITEDITKDNTPYILEQIKAFEKEDATAPIKVYINCFGGSVIPLFSILDMLELCKAPIYTINMGEADSAAALILAAGTKRFCTKSSMVMLHELQIKTIISGSASDVESLAKEIKIINDRIFTELSKFTKKTVDELKADLSGKDLNLNAEEAIAYGVADEIITTEIAEKYQLKKEMPGKSFDGDIKIKRGENQMTKDEILLALRKDFDIDVLSLQKDLTETKAKLAEAEKAKEIIGKVKEEQEVQLTALKKEKAEKETALENSKKEQMLTKAIAERKVLPSEKEAFLGLHKTAADLEAFLSKLQPKLNGAAAGAQSADDVALSGEFDEVTTKCIKEGHFTAEEARKFLQKKEDK
jgi:ATP-dependent Clp protease protease subunit